MPLPPRFVCFSITLCGFFLWTRGPRESSLPVWLEKVDWLCCGSAALVQFTAWSFNHVNTDKIAHAGALGGGDLRSCTVHIGLVFVPTLSPSPQHPLPTSSTPATCLDHLSGMLHTNTPHTALSLRPTSFGGWIQDICISYKISPCVNGGLGVK